jgi:tetratricopeptide (TPR) repeat protein
MGGAKPKDPVIAALVDLAEQELVDGRYATAAYIARLGCIRAPDEPDPQRLLSLTASAQDQDNPQSSEFFYAIGEAHRLLGENEIAASNYRKALTLNQDFALAHIGLARLRMPGDPYYAWLDRFYATLSPPTVLEIGIFDGASLARVLPPTLAIGVDPDPRVIYSFKAETHIFTETSDDFFARQGPDLLLRTRPLGIGFIDGLHHYEQALKDFVNLENYCGPRSMILLHDTVPLDEATQSRALDTQFHTGDVWKTVLCLKHYRPDLDLFTIATPWTGLTVVTHLDPGSRILADGYDEAVKRFIDVPFCDIENRLDNELNMVPNDWGIVQSRLKKHGIL